MAIDDIYDEHEQGERVRDWLRRNFLGLLAGIGLGLVLIFGWQYWQKYQQGQRVQAGTGFQAVVDTIAAGNLEQAQSLAASLEGDTYRIPRRCPRCAGPARPGPRGLRVRAGSHWRRRAAAAGAGTQTH